MTNYSDLIAMLRADYCSCTEGYTSRGLIDPHCGSCQTRDERHEAADALEAQAREIERLRADFVASCSLHKHAGLTECEARLAEVIAERDSLRTMLLNERAEWMDEALKRQASVNAHLAALVTDAQEELRKCQQDAIALQARLAEAERERDEALALLTEAREYAENDLMAVGHAPESLDRTMSMSLLRRFIDRIDAFLAKVTP